MEKDLGYQEMVVLAKRLEERGTSFAADADKSQQDGMSAYLIAQENALQQARFAAEQHRNEFLTVAKACIANTDKNATLRLLRAYGEFGLKEN